MYIYFSVILERKLGKQKQTIWAQCYQQKIGPLQHNACHKYIHWAPYREPAYQGDGLWRQSVCAACIMK